jgi:hypothetical protein
MQNLNDNDNNYFRRILEGFNNENVDDYEDLKNINII